MFYYGPGLCSSDHQLLIAKFRLKLGDDLRLTTLKHFERLLSATSIVKAAHNIKNSAVALELVLHVFENHLEYLQTGWVNEEKQREVPIATILGSDTIPLEVAKTIKRAVDRMVDAGEVDAKEKWKALETMAAKSLEGGSSP